MRRWAMAFSKVVLTCSWPISSANVCGRYLRAMTWYMRGDYARPRVIRGTRVKPLPLLPSGPGGVRGRPLHEARGLTTFHASRLGRGRDFGSARKGDRTFAAAACVILVYTIRLAMQSTKVGIREFRENLSSYLESSTPVAITRHGATIGIYVPTKPKPSQADLEAFRVAGEKLDALIAAAGTSEEELMEDFKRLRRERRKQKA